MSIKQLTPKATMVDLAESDVVFVHGIQFEAIVGDDTWGRPKPQPVVVDVDAGFNIQLAAEADKIDHALDYRIIYNDCVRSEAGQQHRSIDTIADKIAANVARDERISSIKVSITLPKALRQSEKGITYTLFRKGSDKVSSSLRLNGIRLYCIIGIHPHEQKAKQPVVMDIELFEPHAPPKATQLLYATFIQNVEDSKFATLEKFVSEFAYQFWVPHKPQRITIQACKASVFPYADGPGVRITRTADYFSARHQKRLTQLPAIGMIRSA
jgi:dihydroneopterin aldolase/2-amino-4-hydroxy-6-hydroxymethyldihydropteridine diphosphokinase/dihydropteroate synthase